MITIFLSSDGHTRKEKIETCILEGRSHTYIGIHMSKYGQNS